MQPRLPRKNAKDANLVSSGKHNMTVRVAINGFGRIGRNVLRAIAEYSRKDVTLVAINDVGDVETNVHLLKYDSVHGPFRGEVKVSGDTYDVGFGPIKVLAERDPSKLPGMSSTSTSSWSALASFRIRKRPSLT
jgi:hypothetical protein